MRRGPVDRASENIHMHVVFLGVRYIPQDNIVERGKSAVECRTRNQESLGSNPRFATVSKFWHFSSLHNASVHSAV